VIAIDTPGAGCASSARSPRPRVTVTGEADPAAAFAALRRVDIASSTTKGTEVSTPKARCRRSSQAADWAGLKVENVCGRIEGTLEDVFVHLTGVTCD